MLLDEEGAFGRRMRRRARATEFSEAYLRHFADHRGSSTRAFCLRYAWAIGLLGPYLPNLCLRQ